MMDNKLYLWQITYRSLGLTKDSRSQGFLRVLCTATCESDLMAHLYQNFRKRSWWDQVIVLNIEGYFDVQYIQDLAPAPEVTLGPS